MSAAEHEMTTTVCMWEVFPSDSRFPIVACGMTRDPCKARRDVELAMTRPGAGTGQLVRVPIPGLRPGPCERSIWPPLGEVQQCRRTRRGGCSWHPACPAPYATPSTAAPAEPAYGQPSGDATPLPSATRL